MAPPVPARAQRPVAKGPPWGVAPLAHRSKRSKRQGGPGSPGEQLGVHSEGRDQLAQHSQGTAYGTGQGPAWPSAWRCWLEKGSGQGPRGEPALVK
jgi:hypothetical protein